jgi:hypothetical protein
MYNHATICECQRWLSAHTTLLSVSANNVATAAQSMIQSIKIHHEGGLELLSQLVESGHIRAYLYSKRPSMPSSLRFDEADVRAHFGIDKMPPRSLKP